MADPPPRPVTFTDNPMRERTVVDPSNVFIDFKSQIAQMIAEAVKSQAEAVKRQAEAEQRQDALLALIQRWELEQKGKSEAQARMVQAQQAEAQKIAAIDLSEREKAQAKQKRENEKREAEAQHLQSIEKESEEVQRRAAIEYARETTAPPEQEETHNQVAPIEEIAKAELLGITSESVFFTVDLFSSDVPVLCYFDSFGSASLSSFARVFPHMRNSADATQSRLGGTTLDVLLNAGLFAVVSSSKVWDPGGSCSTSCCRTAAANDTDTDKSDTTQSE